jgi:UDP-3-O-[3-hydroxymyristoyl] N-acetylglucosamine deacetylase/3-hydroxyacyl-[acyl-carrier-protein] dehydratase
MHHKQHTIKEPVTLSGTGLHTGQNCTLSFRPAPANHGIKFKRIDLEGQPVIDALVDYVVDVSRGTTLEQNGARIGTIEHVLAALVGLQIDNVLIEVDAPEAPIMDGSAKLFVDVLQRAGLEEQSAVREFLEVDEGIFYREADRNVEIAALPLNDYRVTVMIDYNSPVLGSQHASLNDITRFGEEIASSRTFCFLHELEELYRQNLVRGGDLNNAIVVVDRVVQESELQHLAHLFNKPTVSVKKEGILNNVELRHKNEPARHKLLDMVGDLALVGKPIKAQILAARPGHAANVAFARKLKKTFEKNAGGRRKAPHYDPNIPPVLDINEISRRLPHRYPFALLDKVIYLDDQAVVGVKNVTMNEPFFQGHFPNNPVMPGVLQVEAMAQTGGILVLNTVPDPENYWTYFLSIDSCKFRKMVLPGDTIVFRCELIDPITRGIAKMQGQAFVGNTLVCESTMTARIVRKDL